MSLEKTRGAERTQRTTVLHANRALPLTPCAPFSTHTCSTKRTWLPNVQPKRLWSALLGTSVRLNVTTTALRTMDRVGGLDEYILRTTPKQLASEAGEGLRARLLEKIEEQEQQAAAAAAAAKGAKTPELR